MDCFLFGVQKVARSNEARLADWNELICEKKFGACRLANTKAIKLGLSRSLKRQLRYREINPARSIKEVEFLAL